MATGTDILFKEPNPAGSRQRDQIGLRGPIQYDVLYERANLGPTEGRDGRLRGEKEFEFQKNFVDSERVSDEKQMRKVRLQSS